MISTYIVDDEPHAVAVLKKYIEQTPGLFLKGFSMLPQQALSDICTGEPPDIAFIDVDMPVLSGLELAGLLPLGTRVIFTTSFREYGPEAFEKNALDYLLKPFGYERFAAALQKFRKLQRVPEMPQAFFINGGTKGKLVRIAVDELWLIKSEENYVSLHLTDGVRLIDYTLQEMLERLPGGQFARVHRSYIVQIAKIKEITGGTVILRNDAVIPIGRVYAGPFFALLEKSTLIAKS